MDIKQFPKSPDDMLKERDHTREEQQDTLLAVAKRLKASKDFEEERHAAGKESTFLREI